MCSIYSSVITIFTIVILGVITTCIIHPTCTGTNYYSSAHFGQGTGPIFLDNMECLGTELRLLDCSYDSITTEDIHAEDVGVRCPLC